MAGEGKDRYHSSYCLPNIQLTLTSLLSRPSEGKERKGKLHPCSGAQETHRGSNVAGRHLHAHTCCLAPSVFSLSTASETHRLCENRSGEPKRAAYYIHWLGVTFRMTEEVAEMSTAGGLGGGGVKAAPPGDGRGEISVVPAGGKDIWLPMLKQTPPTKAMLFKAKGSTDFTCEHPPF